MNSTIARQIFITHMESEKKRLNSLISSERNEEKKSEHKKALKKIPKTIAHCDRLPGLAASLCEDWCNDCTAQNISITVDKDLLLQSIYIHDIAKSTDNERHNEQAVVWNVLQKYEPDEPKNLLAIIENHSGDFVPGDNPRESAVLRFVDKVDKYNKAAAKKKQEKQQKAYEKAKKSCEKCLEELSSSWGKFYPNEFAIFEQKCLKLEADVRRQCSLQP